MEKSTLKEILGNEANMKMILEMMDRPSPIKVVSARTGSLKYWWYRLRYGKPGLKTAPLRTTCWYWDGTRVPRKAELSTRMSEELDGKGMWNPIKEANEQKGNQGPSV